MEWNTNLRPFVSRPDPSSFSFLYNYNYDHYPGMEVKHPAEMMAGHMVVPPLDKGGCFGNQEKKKRLTNSQLESLESSFQEEIKLDPDRKMKLSRELGLQPRQVAVWFQNRRARWKAKQLESLYDALKQEFNAVSREKQKLQEEVLKLKAMLVDQATGKQVSAGYTEISGEETVGSTSAAMHSSSKGRCTSPQQPPPPPPPPQQQNGSAECHYLFNMDEYNPISPPYWVALPSYP
ncbi:hypothetical protein Nepgr_032016 [Nepenthes gracilis]|uniref:Homeobox-leucine zipper protein n=1 Tax=Nepenthes gracilis TaxID=150966 RepID=A0AAD3TJP1_NEPGR|nr:hypothetical protein Nepgr_032016 [Nepenthes gracilis]